ncbi:MAG: hypothetical protein R6T99_00310, partial [Bacteroidales bacterium]
MAFEGSPGSAPMDRIRREIEFEEEEEEEEDLEGYTEASGKVVRLVDQSIITAFRRNASDIHVESSETLQLPSLSISKHPCLELHSVSSSSSSDSPYPTKLSNSKGE